MTPGDDERKTININFKVSPTFYDQLTEYVEGINSSRSQFIRLAIKEQLPDTEPILGQFANDLETLAFGNDGQQGV